MQQLTEQVRQIIDLLGQHLPAESIPPMLPTAAVLLFLGAVICSLGAKLARWFIASVFAAAGVAAGLWVAQRFSLPAVPSSLVGCLLCGTFGYVLHRLWVGIFAATFLGAVAMTIFSTQQVFPRMMEFQDTLSPVTQAVDAAAEEFSLPAPAGDQNAVTPPTQDFFGDFRAYIEQEYPKVYTYGALWTLGAALLGLVLGVFFCRLTLILFTAIFGTWMLAIGISALATYMGIDIYRTCQESPAVSAAALGSFLIVSVFLQTYLTKPEPAPAKASSKNAD